MDYIETFSPVAKSESFRLALAIALRYRMKSRQLDLETAFHYTNLEEDVFMAPPSGNNVKGIA